MGVEEPRHRGVVREIGLERDEESFRNFNLTIGVTVKIAKNLTYEEGERVARRFRKELLGKNIELEAIAIPCPICGKTYNTGQGMKQHLRRTHKNGEKPKKTASKKKAAPAKKKAAPKNNGKKPRPRKKTRKK
jgi:hypothetical protein